MFSYVMTYNLDVLLCAYASSCCVQQLSRYSNFHNSQNTMQVQHSVIFFYFLNVIASHTSWSQYKMKMLRLYINNKAQS